ncbi:MAG: isochorismatase family protein [Anaerolineales bacterium]|nr:isochorismatase family protein [Anaerolineales bacterium]
MSKEISIHQKLIDADNSCLIVIDVQRIFLDKLPEEDSEQLVIRLLWLVNVAKRLEIPLIVTAEDIEKNGSIIPELEAILPSDTYVKNKMIFGLAADQEILSVVQDTKRNIAILVGLETDVCVAQSALGLLEQGYQVVVVEDATGSPGKAHQYGLSRIDSAGALISNVKALFYEWMRSVEGCREFFSKYEDELGDPGVAL